MLTPIKHTMSALFGILSEVEKKFNKAESIDKKVKKHFLEVTAATAPPLTKAEEELLNRVAGLEKKLSKGKRVKGNLKEDLDKFLWKEGDLDFAGFIVDLDASAEAVFAEFVAFDTYERGDIYVRQNGGLPREIRKIPSSHSILYRLGMKFKAPYANRLFDCW